MLPEAILAVVRMAPDELLRNTEHSLGGKFTDKNRQLNSHEPLEWDVPARAGVVRLEGTERSGDNADLLLALRLDTMSADPPVLRVRAVGDGASAAASFDLPLVKDSGTGLWFPPAPVFLCALRHSQEVTVVGVQGGAHVIGCRIRLGLQTLDLMSALLSTKFYTSLKDQPGLELHGLFYNVAAVEGPPCVELRRLRGHAGGK